MQASHFKDFLKKFLNRSIEPGEERALEDFDKKMLSRFFLEEEWDSRHSNKIRKSILKALPKEEKKVRPVFSVMKVAASIVLLLGLGVLAYYIFNNEPQPAAKIVKTTDWGQKLDLVLADGSKIKLNSGSVIKFPETFNDSIREVELDGEAFFDVAENPGKPFVIRSENLKTTVLGTSFNINADPGNEKIAVTVATGQVKIESGNYEAFLTTNEQGIFDKSSSTISKKTIDIRTFLEWKEGILRFENSTLAEVAVKLGRWFNVKFEFENEEIKKCRFTGKFNNEGLQTILEGLVFVKEGLVFQREQNNVIVLSGKCTD